MNYHYEHKGFCPCCETPQTFATSSDRFRDTLSCPNCGSIPRERAVALVLNEILPNWKSLSIHESSPSPRALSERMVREAPHYVASQYFWSEPLGSIVKGFENQNLESQTFEDERFDLVLSLDVMEHVFNPDKVYSEVFRTLRKGGYYLHTFPIRKYLVDASTPLAKFDVNGRIVHLTSTPEYHGNPIDEKGSLVTWDYGYDISKQIAQWAPFDVRIIRFWDQTHGVIGEYTEVIVCRKPELSTGATRPTLIARSGPAPVRGNDENPGLSVMTREQKLLQFVDRNAVGLEIGPSYSPVAPKMAGWNVETVDHLTATDLRKKYAAWGVDGSKIEEVDYVTSENSIFDAIHKEDHFDFIIASHVIEHMTDLLRFLVDCQKLLKADGVLSLAIPDKRFCFDIFKPVSSTGMVLQAYHENRTHHLPGLIFDQYANHVMCGDKIIWFDRKLDDLRIVHSVPDARVRMDDFIKSGTFVDIHAWFFTPSSFRLIIQDLNEMGSINMGEAAFHPTDGFEFFVTLKKGLKMPGNERLALLRCIDAEIRGHAQT